MFRFLQDRTQVREFFSWASDIVGPDDVILVENGTQKDFYRFKFPMRAGCMPRKVFRPQETDATFIVHFFNSQEYRRDVSEEWTRLFRSPTLGIWEKKSRIREETPLRHGLTAAERMRLAEIARKSISAYVVHGEITRLERSSLLPRFTLPANVDVALWVDGHIRGSIFVEGAPLAEGVAKAARLACADNRHKPIRDEDIDRIAVQITVMSDMRFTLTPEEISSNSIYADKGYVIQTKDKKGFFLPSTFNVQKFANLSGFLQNLATEKARLSSLSRDARVLIFEVHDFIALPKESTTHSLTGPSSKKPVAAFSFGAMGHAAAEWLLRIQEPDGNLPPIISPVRAIGPRVDWIRLPCTAWALAEFGHVTGHSEYVASAQKSLDFVKKYMFEHSLPQVNIPPVLAYTGQLARTLGDRDAIPMIVSRLVKSFDFATADTITVGQVVGCLSYADEHDLDIASKLRDMRVISHERFVRAQASGESMNLAIYAELVRAFEKSDPAFSERIAQWLSKMQQDDGSFPQSTTSSFAYTRSTGKVFEVLALEAVAHAKELKRAGQWLFDRQYDENNLFFVTKSMRDMLRGGFRHDHQNSDAWIDAAGHMLLGVARIMKS